MSRRWRRAGLAVAAAVTAVLSVCVPAALAGQVRAPARPAATMLQAGRVGTRAEVPWKSVGSGWALAEFTTTTATTDRPTTLYLVDPAGGIYRLYQWPAVPPGQRWQLVAWSGDKARALFEVPSSSGGPTMHQLVLATGKATTLRLPAATSSIIGYTDPLGASILAGDDGIVRFSLTGKLQDRLIKGANYVSALSAPNGLSYVVNGAAGVELVSNGGGIIRRLPVPGTDTKSGAGCSPVRWWNSSTALVMCVPAAAGPRLWLVPVSGAAPKALTALRNGTGPDLGDVDAWRVSGALYVQALGACGVQFIGKQAADGKVETVTVPGSPGNNIVDATSGSRMLVNDVEPCNTGSSLVWFNPATRAVQKVLHAASHELGVLSVVAYDRQGNQPGSLR